MKRDPCISSSGENSYSLWLVYMQNWDRSENKSKNEILKFSEKFLARKHPYFPFNQEKNQINKSPKQNHKQGIFPSLKKTVRWDEAECRTCSFAGALDHYLFSLQTESSQSQRNTETKFIDLHKTLRCHHKEWGNETYELEILNYS